MSTWRTSQAEDLQAVLVDLDLLEIDSARPPGWIAEPDVLARALATAGFVDVRVIEDPLIARYDDLDHYWQSVRVTGSGRRAAALDAAQIERVRDALAERLRAYQQPNGIHVEMAALLAVASG